MRNEAPIGANLNDVENAMRQTIGISPNAEVGYAVNGRDDVVKEPARG